MKIYLEDANYTVYIAEDGEKALPLFNEVKPDLVVLDLMLPKISGESICKAIRQTSRVPIIMLTARGEEEDKVRGLEAGADDYITKPFSPKELMLRVQAILKRSNSSIAPNKEILEFEGLKIDFTGRLVYVNEEKVNLSPKEYELLFYLVRNRGIALTREKLINDVWGYDFFGDDRTLDTHIKLLRKALGEYSRYIVTLRGVGYRFEG